MKYLIVSAAFLLTVLAFPAKVHAAEALLLNDTASFTASFGSAAKITDLNRSTKQAFNGGGEVRFECSEGIASLYFIWDEPAAEWALYTDDGAVAAANGNNAFLHEYVAPFENAAGNAVTYNSLTLKVKGGALCDVYLFGTGSAPKYVQKWQPPYQDADMLVLPTHADDEHLYFGGAMPYYSADKKIQVAYFTNHNGEKYRRHEQLDGLWAVGITAYPVISDFTDAYADSVEQAIRLYPEQEALEFQVMLLRRFKPEVVIAHDINGEYGHGVHKYNAQSLQRALEAAADSSQLPALYGAFDVPKAYFHLLKENEIIMDWSAPLEHFNGKSALEMAKEGYNAHKSQHQWSFAVEDFGPYDCRKFGLYKTTVGLDTAKNDFFENITPQMYSDYIPPEPQPKVKEEAEAVQTPQALPSYESAFLEEKRAGEEKHEVILICALLIIVLGLAAAIFILAKASPGDGR